MEGGFARQPGFEAPAPQPNVAPHRGRRRLGGAHLFVGFGSIAGHKLHLVEAEKHAGFRRFHAVAVQVAADGPVDHATVRQDEDVRTHRGRRRLMGRFGLLDGGCRLPVEELFEQRIVGPQARGRAKKPDQGCNQACDTQWMPGPALRIERMSSETGGCAESHRWRLPPEAKASVSGEWNRWTRELEGAGTIVRFGGPVNTIQIPSSGDWLASPLPCPARGFRHRAGQPASAELTAGKGGFDRWITDAGTAAADGKLARLRVGPPRGRPAPFGHFFT